jgi:sulfite exporter TauE/SafE
MPDLQALSAAAVSIAFIHTVFGPDHYLPFVAMSKVGRWSTPKTATITLLCGLGHVLSSVALGCVGIAFGIVVLKLEHIEEIRGDLAGWLLLTFGLIYFAWGLARALRNEPHVHVHAAEDGSLEIHQHANHQSTGRPEATDDNNPLAAYASPTTRSAAAENQRRAMTPWVLFTIFLFGPCEPLIPMLMYPAALGSAWGVVLVTLLFGITTIATMLALVLGLRAGAGVMQLGWMERYSHALAGLVVLACGAAIKLGL